MKKTIQWIKANLLFLLTIFLIMFIPLYPKLPLLDVVNTWVYIRVEDFLVLSVIFVWLVLFVRKKVSLKTPLTFPILLYWAIGAIATIHAVILIFPETANVFPNVAFLSYLRHIEYASLFFIAYSSIKSKKNIYIAIGALYLTLLSVIVYGFGQKYLGFPAFLTGNEEFAKGTPIILSQLSRVPSTFAGHYDLAAYLVIVIPIFTSLALGVKNLFLRAIFAAVSLLGVVLLFMTVSRVSVFVLLIALLIVLYLQLKKLFIVAVPILAILAVVFFSLQPALLDRFSNTVNEVNVLVDAETGAAVGHVNFVDRTYLEDKSILVKEVEDKKELDSTLAGKEDLGEATPSAQLTLLQNLPDEIPLVLATNVSNGETLPQGTSYINLPISPVTKELGNFFYEIAAENSATTSAPVVIIHGKFIVKRASAYDLSFTTRFQGEWPHAIDMFRNNVFLGSGYSSVGLAVDNNYLRMLGDTGLLGTVSFFMIFVAFFAYIRRVLPDVNSKATKSFIVGAAAGIVGLFLNALLIDVFEASKVAFFLWALLGIIAGTLTLYKTKHFNTQSELLKALTSPVAIISYIAIGTIAIFSQMIGNYFIGDDFTWFRWAADTNDFTSAIKNYFFTSNGFFYRPGTKLYFYIMYNIFWLNQVVYHLVSIGTHFVVASLFFLLSKKLFKNTTLGAIAAFLFLLMSGYVENVFWIAATGHMFNAAFALSSLYFFILWEESQKKIYFVASLSAIVLGLLFHELGVVAPLLAVSYKQLVKPSKLKQYFSPSYILLFTPVPVYLLMRLISQSHWQGGDYSYNLVNLPFNVFGNLFGYIMLTYLGPLSIPIYSSLRNVGRDHIIVSIITITILTAASVVIVKKCKNLFSTNEKRLILFAFVFFVITLLPFLGLGNITSRYSYLATFAPTILMVLLVQKAYGYLRQYGQQTALSAIFIALATFALLHIIQVQKIHGDWSTAGDKVERFFVSIDSIYDNSWSDQNVSLHFVNVPISQGQAWVFPVGLEDALWLSFRNPNLRVVKHDTTEDAMRQTTDSPKIRILEFQDNGGVERILRPQQKSDAEQLQNTSERPLQN